MKKFFILFIGIVYSYLSSAQQLNYSDRGSTESCVTLNKNGSSKTYYYLQTDQASNPNFGGSLGEFGTGCSLVISGEQKNTYSCSGCVLANGTFFYRIYPTGETAPNFSRFPMPLASNDAGECGRNQTWRNNSQNINVLNGRASGTYIIEILTQNPISGGCPRLTLFSYNYGSTYKATFTVLGPPTLQPNASMCLGNSVTLTGSCASGTPKWSTGEVAAEISVNPTVNTTYTATCKTAEGYESATSSSVNVTVNSLSIIDHPITQFDCEPNSIRFLANASTTSTDFGSAITYQWQRKLSSESSFTALTNAIPTVFSGNILQVSPTGSPNVSGTQFRYIATDGNGCTVTSNPATLYLNSVGSMTNNAVCENTNYALTVPILSEIIANVLSYQWEVLDATSNTWGNVSSGGGISGATTQTLNFTSIPFVQDGKKYRCKVVFNVSVNNDNDGSINQGAAITCSRTSAEVTIKVKLIPPTPIINTTSPQNACLGASITLNSTGCAGVGGTTSWYENGVVVSSNAIYTFTPSAVSSKTYQALCTKSACESALSASVVVNINPIPVVPSITINPLSAVVCQGNAFALTMAKELVTNKVRWYNQAAGGTAVSSSSATTTSSHIYNIPISDILPTNSTTPSVLNYWVEQENTFGCKSTRSQTNFTVNPTPSAPTITSSINYCQNATTNSLIATATGSNALLWYGTTSSGVVSSVYAPIPTSTALGATNYYVSQKNTYACESTRAAISVVINSIPQAPSATTSFAYCKNSAANVLSAVAAGSNSLIWYDENDIILGAAPTPNTSIAGTKIYKVGQKSPAPASCESAKTTITVTINDLPPAPIAVTPVGYCRNTTAAALSATASGTNALIWYGTSAIGGESSVSSPTPVSTSPGITSYYVSQKDGNNCEGLRAKIDVEITPSVLATVSGTNAFCLTGVLNNSTTLTANPTGGNGLYTYQWQNLAGNIALVTSQTFETNSMIQTTNSDTYKVTVTSGYCSATANLTVTKQGWSDVPNVSVSPIGDICGIGLKTLSVISPNTGTYGWYADATTLIQTATGTTFSTPNLTSTITYYVAREQQITSNLTCQTVRTATTINVNTVPDIPIIVNSANKTTFCNTESSVTLSVSCTSGSGQYRLNNGGWISRNSVTITPSTYTTITTLNYDFKCSISISCENGVASTSITVNPAPNAPTISGNTSICSGSSTTLTAAGCSGTVVWSNGVSGNSITVLVAGAYNATCTVNSCVSLVSATQTITANSIPTAPTIISNDVDNVVCAGTNLVLTSIDCSGTVIWSNGVTANSIIVSQSGAYNATCTVNNCVSLASLTQTVVINQNPNLTLGSIGGICNAATTFNFPYTALTNNPDKYSLTSTMPDFGAVAETDLSVSPIYVSISSGKAGTYSFSLNIKNSITGCSQSRTFNLTVLPVLLDGSIEVSSNTINCAGFNPGEITSLSLASGGKTAYIYQWQTSNDNMNFTDILTATGTTYNPAALNQTTYFRRKVTDACGAEAISSNTHKIQIVPDPQITITDATDRIICSGGVLNLQATVIGGYGTCMPTWQSSISQSGIFTNEQVGGLSFSSTVINTNLASTTKYYRAIYACSGTGSGSCNQGVSSLVKVIINPNPSIPIVNGGGTICSGSSTSLSANGCNGTLQWSNGATTTSISVSIAGNYRAVCTNSCGTSVSSNEIAVNITTVTSPTLVGTTTVCSGQSATLTATGCAGTIVWSNGSSGTSITVSPSTTISYTAICNTNGCTSLNSEAIIVTIAPSIDFTLSNVADLCNSITSFILPYNTTLGSPDKYSLTSTMAGFTRITDANLGISPIFVIIPSGQIGTFSFTLTLKISSTGCNKSQTFNINILPALLGGSIETSSININCSGYIAGVISTVSLASGGKIDYLYQWQTSNDNMNFTDILTATGTTYNPAALNQTTYFRRKVTDACGAEAISSNTHKIQIVPDPQITITDATDRIICSGGVLNLQATVIGGYGTCMPTWQSSISQSGIFTNEQVGGLSFSSTVINTNLASTTKYYRAIYACSGTGSGSCNQGTSSLVKVIINLIPYTPTITPVSVIICPTQSSTLTANGCNGIVIWNGGQTGSTLSVSEAGTYAAICSLNSCVSAISSSITVTLASGGKLVAPPIISGTAKICSGQVTNLLASNCLGKVTWSNGGTGNSISVNPSISTDYTAICFDGTCTSSSSNKITITVNSYPNIITQPKNEADCNGNSVTFSLTALSATSYQWQRKVPDGSFIYIANAVSNTLTISEVGSSIDPNQTEYRVVLANGSCSVTSTVALLTVNSIVGNLADKTICDGGNVSFNLSNIVISGSIQSYQWQRRVGTSGTWNDIVAATTTTLIINAASKPDEQYYRCKVNLTAGSSTCTRYTSEDDSNGAKLTVLVTSTPKITGANIICKGKDTKLTVNNCDGIIAWSNGLSMASITVLPTINTSYTVSCTSTQCGFNVTSEPFIVSVNETPQPEIVTYDIIAPATLVFAAKTTVSNANLLWYNNASGGTGTTTAPLFTAVGTYSYWVTQTDPITGCESARLPIIAKVLDYFHISQQPTNQVDCKGNSVFLGVVAVGPNLVFNYQWQRKRPNESDFINLVEEGNGIRGWYARTMTVLNVGNIHNPDKTQYRCIVSNNGQFISSEISTLTVNSLEGSIPNLGICVGGNNEFNLQNYFTIKGNVLNYQWQTRPGTSGVWTNLIDGNGISGSDKSVLKFTDATYEQGVYYRCLVKFNTQGFECTESTDAAKLIVSGFPPKPSVSSIFNCQNTNAVRLKVDSPIQNLVWYSQEIGGIGNTVAPTPNTNIAGVFKYYVADRTDEGCEGQRAIINVEVGEVPPAPKNTTLSSVNEGDLLTFSAEGTPAKNQVLRWYYSPTITTFSITAPTFTAAGTYSRYVAQVSAFGCVGPRTPISSTIIPSLKFTKQPLSQADCDGNSVTFTVSAMASSIFSYQWQRQKHNETLFMDLPNANSNSLKISDIGNVENPNLSKYRCIIKDDKNTVISEEAILTVNQIIGKLATMSLCDGKTSKLTFNGLTIIGNIAKYQWQKKVGTSYTDIPTSLNGEATINEIGTYRGRITFIVDRTTTCIRTTEDLKVEAKPSPVVPLVTNQSACQNTAFDITKAVTATNSLVWYESATDSTADKITPKIDITKLGKNTFFVSQINALGCESERKSFDVVVLSIPEKPITSDLTYCRNAPRLELVATTTPQNQVIWYPSLSAKDAFGQVPIPNVKTDGEIIFFAAAKNTAGCESERVPLKVVVAPCIATFENNFNTCLLVSADSVKGNQWFDLYDSAGRLYASINPNGLNLGKVSISIRHYGQGSAAIPATKNDTKFMARYVDFQSSLLKEFNSPVSLRIYYENNELKDYKTATDLPNLTINDFNIVYYDGIREDCGFENNDNFVEGESYVIYKNVVGNQIAKDFFYLQFDVNEFSENGATANDFTEITFSGKETENQTIALNWQSKFEIKAEKYILERSADCENFVKIGEIKANGISSNYKNIDFQPLAGKNCYRLVYIDKDGTKKYLDAIEVNFTDPNPVCSVFPNPWVKGDEINLYLRNIKEKEIKLYDMLGQEFSFNMNKNEAQIIKIRTDVHLSKGIHFVVVVGEDGKKCVHKVVINP